MPGQYLVRAGMSDDADALAGLFAEFYAEAGRAPPAMGAAELRRDGLRPDGKFSVLVAEQTDLVGFAFWCLTFDTDLVAGGGHLLDLYVAPGHRRRGVGRALMAACARDVKAGGALFLTWDTDPANAAARALYTPLGRATDPLVTFVADGTVFDDLAAEAS